MPNKKEGGKCKIGREGLPLEFTEAEKRFNKSLLSNFRLDEESILILQDIALGIEPKEIPTALSEDAKQRVIQNVLASLKQRP